MARIRFLRLRLIERKSIRNAQCVNTHSSDASHMTTDADNLTLLSQIEGRDAIIRAACPTQSPKLQRGLTPSPIRSQKPPRGLTPSPNLPLPDLIPDLIPTRSAASGAAPKCIACTRC